MTQEEAYWDLLSRIKKKHAQTFGSKQRSPACAKVLTNAPLQKNTPGAGVSPLTFYKAEGSLFPFPTFPKVLHLVNYPQPEIGQDHWLCLDTWPQ